VDAGSGNSPAREAKSFDDVSQKFRALARTSEETMARLEETRALILRGRSQREILHDSEFARLVARQETMAVIEQAKGIIMAERRCGPEEAFDLLRLASQRTNIKVHVLAEQIVERIASGGDADNVTPISRNPGPGTQAEPSPKSPRDAAPRG
jgi:hypothetical protein